MTATIEARPGPDGPPETGQLVSVRDRRWARSLDAVRWAAITSADTLALGLLCEATGRGLPVVVLPYLNAAQAEHPALGEGIERLRRLGVRVLFGPDVLVLHQPRQGQRDRFPWHLTLPAL